MTFNILWTQVLLIICFVEIIGRPLITIVHIRVSLSLSFIVTNMLIYLAGNKYLLEDFIKFNDFQNNQFVVKRVLKLLNQTFKNYYATNKSEEHQFSEN